MPIPAIRSSMFVQSATERGRMPSDLAHDWLVLNRAPAPVPITGPVTQNLYDGTAGHDVIIGTDGDDGFDMGQGGDDFVAGKGGQDIFLYEDAFTAADSINGGADAGGGFDLILRDALYLDGDYSAGVVFGAGTVTNVENIYLMPGHSYSLTLNDNTIKTDAIMAIRASTLGAGEDTVIDNSAATADGSNLLFYAGAGKDKFTGGGSTDAVFFTEDTLQTSDRINGGATVDSIVLNGDFSGGFTFGAKTFKNVEALFTTFGNDYSLKTDDANIGAGDRLVVYGSPLGAGNSLIFDGSSERDGYFLLLGGPDHDELTGGRRNDDISGGGGGDFITGGKGNDRILYAEGGSESFGSRHDFIHGFDFAGADRFVLDFVPAAIDANINTGSLSPLTFDADLSAAVNAGNLAANHAVLFTPDAGSLAGELFLIVDANGTAGYQGGGADLVVRLIDPVHLGALDTADFTAV